MRPSLPLYFPKGQVSPLLQLFLSGADLGPVQASIESDDALHPPYCSYLPSVALDPSSLLLKGWVWMRPSPCEWIPAWMLEFSAENSKAGTGLSHSPQMFTPRYVCQWLPAWLLFGSAANGGPLPLALLLSLTEMTSTITRMTTIAPVAMYQPVEPPRRRRGLR